MRMENNIEEGAVLLSKNLQPKTVYICLDRKGNIDFTFIPTIQRYLTATI